MRRVARRLLDRNATKIAPFLLNKLLVHGDFVGRIVEVEAYGQDDPVSRCRQLLVQQRPAVPLRKLPESFGKFLNVCHAVTVTDRSVWASSVASSGVVWT